MGLIRRLFYRKFDLVFPVVLLLKKLIGNSTWIIKIKKSLARNSSKREGPFVGRSLGLCGLWSWQFVI